MAGYLLVNVSYFVHFTSHHHFITTVSYAAEMAQSAILVANIME